MIRFLATETTSVADNRLRCQHRFDLPSIANELAILTVRQPFFGAMGCTAAIVFTCLGASYGTAKSGVGIAAMGVLRPDLIVKSTSTTAESYLARILGARD